MSTSNLVSGHFDDSEDEDDNFNPLPADISDNEDAGESDHDDDAGAQIRNEASTRRVDDGSDDEASNSRSRPVGDDVDEDDEDAEGEGEDIRPGAHDDDDEDDEDDEEEEIDTVSPFLLHILGNGPVQKCLK